MIKHPLAARQMDLYIYAFHSRALPLFRRFRRDGKNFHAQLVLLEHKNPAIDSDFAKLPLDLTRKPRATENASGRTGRCNRRKGGRKKKKGTKNSYFPALAASLFAPSSSPEARGEEGYSQRG